MICEITPLSNRYNPSSSYIKRKITQNYPQKIVENEESKREWEKSQIITKGWS